MTDLTLAAILILARTANASSSTSLSTSTNLSDRTRLLLPDQRQQFRHVNLTRFLFNLPRVTALDQAGLLQHLGEHLLQLRRT